MRIVGRKIVGGVLAAVTALGLAFGTSTPAAADVVPQHWHCLYIETVEGYVLIAQGVSEEALGEALEQFHYQVHLGQLGRPGEPLKITRALSGQCPQQLNPPVAE